MESNKLIEVWKPIKNYEGFYEVSNIGRIRSKDRIVKSGRAYMPLKGAIKKLCISKNPYLTVSLCKNGRCKRFNVHSLVALTFLNHKPQKTKLIIDHINDIKFDNRVVNLQLITQRENVAKTKVKSTSKYTGVYLDKKSNKWIANIWIKKSIYLGRFEDEFQAHLAYQKKLKEI